MGKSRNLLLVLPPLLFLVFASVAWVGLRRENPDELPSALVGGPAPAIGRTLALRDDPPPTDADLRAPGVKLVNFWASWCGPCRVEHPILTALAAEGIPVIGVNYKDEPAKTQAFLARVGDPYARRLVDRDGRAGVEFGVTGVPETFLVGRDGVIRDKHTGPLTAADAETLAARIR